MQAIRIHDQSEQVFLLGHGCSGQAGCALQCGELAGELECQVLRISPRPAPRSLAEMSRERIPTPLRHPAARDHRTLVHLLHWSTMRRHTGIHRSVGNYRPGTDSMSRVLVGRALRGRKCEGDVPLSNWAMFYLLNGPVST
jgi:hypothetical protein